MNYHRVGLPSRWRWRQRWQTVCRAVADMAVPAVLGLWVGGTWWLVDRFMDGHPDPSFCRVVEATVMFAATWGAALAVLVGAAPQRLRRRAKRPEGG